MSATYQGAIADDVREVVDRLIASACREVGGAERIAFVVVPAPCIQVEGRFCFGAFSSSALTILVAGEPPEPDITRADWLAEMLPEVIAHELAHFEQHRDRRPVQERGVAVRARNLARRMAAAWT